MKLFKHCLGLLCAMLFSFNLSAQDIDDADMSFVAGQTKFNIEYKYDKMDVGDVNDADYIKEKMDKMNAKQQGKGERWKEK